MNIRLYLLENSLAQSTRRSYKHSINLYSTFDEQFNSSHQTPFPISASRLSKFIAYLVAQGLKSSSIHSVLSGLSYVHVLYDWPNPVTHGLIKKMLLGSKRVSATPDSRLPITRKILRSLLKNLPRLFSSVYEQNLFRSMYSLAFHALLRVGEYTVTDSSAHVLQFENLNFQIRGHKIVSCSFVLPHYKHSLTPAVLKIPKSDNTRLCPVVNLVRYCRLRGSKVGPLFLTELGSAVTSRQFSRTLKISIQDLGLPSQLYTPHSFRIGGASFAQQCNYSESRIQSLGRWKSSAFRKYLRTPMLSLGEGNNI